MKKLILTLSLFIAIATVSNAQTPAKKGGAKPTPAVQQATPATAVTPTATATPATATDAKPATEAPACKKKGSSCCKKKVN